MFRALALAAIALSLALPLEQPLAAQGNCARCDLPPGCRGNGNRPRRNCERIDVVVDAGIDFGSLVVIGDGVGRVVIDLGTGNKLVTGNLDDLGGIAVSGHAIVTGAPNEPVIIDFPSIITMSDSSGSSAELRDFVTNLQSGAVLDGNGRLEFSFTATLYTDPSVIGGGTLRGRIPIEVSYQ